MARSRDVSSVRAAKRGTEFFKKVNNGGDTFAFFV